MIQPSRAHVESKLEDIKDYNFVISPHNLDCPMAEENYSDWSLTTMSAVFLDSQIMLCFFKYTTVMQAYIGSESKNINI